MDVCDIGQIVYFCKADSNMVKEIDIWNGDIVLSTVVEMLHKRVRNLSKLQYSFCCSPSGCLPSREAVDSQGAAIGENLLRHSVLSSVAGLFSGRQSLKCSYRYFLRQSRRIVPAAIPSMSLKGSDRYSLRHSRRLAPTDTPSMSLKGSYRNSPAA